MAITREQVLAAVEKYLPRTVNFAQSADLGDRDQAAIYARIQQIILTSLLVDKDAVYYIIYLSTQRLLREVNTTIALLEALEGTEQLKAITGDAPVRIADYTKLENAQTSLVRLSSDVVTSNVFSGSALTTFQADIEGFLADQVVDNVAGGNRDQISSDIRATMAALKASWANVISRRATLFGLLDAYVAEELRTRVSAIIISSIQEKIAALLEELPTLSTTAQAEAAEQVLVDLAAAEAAITIVGSATSPVGTEVVAPSFDGSSGSEYLELEGSGLVEPINTIDSGSTGQLALPGPVNAFVGMRGPLTSVAGQTVIGAGGYTFELSDASVPDFTVEGEGIEVGMYLTFVDTGSTHSITSVTASALLLDPVTPHLAVTLQRYAITYDAPGTIFYDENAEFWDEYPEQAGDNASFASTVVASGAAGELIRDDLATDTDGTNLQTSGTAGTGTFRPRKATGSTADAGGGLGADVFEDLNATFLTDQVVAGDELWPTSGTNSGTTKIVQSVDSETRLTIVGTFLTDTGANDSWYIEDPLADERFEDINATFLSDGVTASSTLALTSGPIGDFDIAEVLSQTQLRLTPGGNPFSSGDTWEIRPNSNSTLFSAVDFYAAGAAVLDYVDITGEGVFQIIAVSQYSLGVDSNFSVDSIVGATFTVYRTPGTSSLTFSQTDGDDFEALGVGPLYTAGDYFVGEWIEQQHQLIITIDGLDYKVKGLNATSPTDTLDIFPVSEGVGTFATGTTFVAALGTFETDGVDVASHELVLTTGVLAGIAYGLTSVDSEIQLTFTAGPGPTGDEIGFEIRPKLVAGVDWEIRYSDTSRQFSTVLLPIFTADSVGDVIVFDYLGISGTLQFRSRIDTVYTSGIVWLADGFLQGAGVSGFQVIPEIRKGMELVAASRTYDIVKVVDGQTLQVDPKLPNSLGTNVDWQILRSTAQSKVVSRIIDPTGAAAYDAVNGFTTALKGLRVDITVTSPLQTSFSRPFDADNDGFAEGFQVSSEIPLGSRGVAYRILSSTENISDTFTVPLLAGSGAALGDVLTLWDDEGVHTISDFSGPTGLIVEPPIAANLVSTNYVVTSGGGEAYGEYLLLADNDSRVDLDADTELLRLRAAEVLIEFGTIVVAIDSGSAGLIDGDTDADGLGGSFSDVGADFSAAEVGDRLTVTYADTSTGVSFLSRVIDSTSARIDPELPVEAALTWVLERNSVSATLNESARLRRQMEALRDVLAGYDIATNATVAGVLDLMQEQRLDRMVDLLYDGDISLLLNVSQPDSSYATSARSAIQTAGASTTSTDVLSNNVAGSDPALTAARTSNTGTSTAGQAAAAGTDAALTIDDILAATPPGYSPISSTNSTTSTSAGNIDEEVEVRVALAKGINDIADDELLRSLSFRTFEESRNRAIYELSGEVESGVISDTDPTLPWVAQTGSARDRIYARYQKVRAAIQYMIDHPGEFDDTEAL